MSVAREYHCVECGHTAPELYKDYDKGIVKISHCSRCEKVVDKYIEYDAIVIILDALLHKSQAYRHLLFNVDMQTPFKYLVIFLLCDAFLKWDNLHNGKSHREIEDHIFYAALERDFYTMFLFAAIEWVVFFAVLLFIAKLGFCGKQLDIRTLVKSIVVSSFGKLLAIPAIIWAQTHSSLYLWLTHLFILTSNTTALKVIYEVPKWKALVLVGSAHLLQYISGYFIMQYYQRL